MNHKIRMGISTCLLGELVRYDGGHKHDRYITDTLGRFFEFVPVCPEVECGMPVPREPIHLEGDPTSPSLITNHTRIDLTDQMLTWTARRLQEVEHEELGGYIFKSKSPSCGMERVKNYNEKGMPSNVGRGIFAGLFLQRFPLIPAEEEGRLHDPELRENFFERVFALKRWRDLIANKSKYRDLIAFHAAHKLQLMAHSPKLLREMGKLVADAHAKNFDAILTTYQSLFMNALKQKATVKKQVNVLQHMMGYFKKQLSTDEKQELLEVIGRYTNGHVPILVPLTLIEHYVRKYDEPYLKQQWFISPHPIELALRNHA